MLLLSPIVYAAPVNDQPFNVTQPDGSVIQARLRGDERMAWTETLDGYTIMQDSSGWWTYASMVGETIKPSSFVVKKHVASALSTPKHVHPTPKEKPNLAEELGLIQPAGIKPQSVIVNGSQPIIFLMVNFTDNPRIDATTYTRDYYNNMMFNFSNPLSFVRYYNEVSYTNFVPNGTIGGNWYTSAYNLAHWGQDSSYPNNVDDANDCIFNLAREAMILADPYVDYSVYDTNHDGVMEKNELSVVITFAGCDETQGASCSKWYDYGTTNAIWAHNWVISVSYTHLTLPTIYSV